MKKEASTHQSKKKAELVREMEILEQQCRALEISEEKQRLLADDLRASEEKFRILLDDSADPIFSFTPEGRYIYVNRAFAEGVCMTVDQIVGRFIWDVFSRDEAEKRFKPLSEVFHTGMEKVIEVRVPRPDDDRYYITTITPIKNNKEQIISAICSSKEITPRKRIEEKLRASEASLQDINTQMNEAQRIAGIGSWTMRFNEILPAWSKEMFRIYGLEPSGGVPAYPDFKSLIHPDDQPRITMLMQAAVIHKRGYTCEHRIIRADGAERIVQQTCEIVLNGSGEPAYILGTTQDITDQRLAEEERRALEKRLQRSEKMEGLGRLAGGVAHDLNNVLGVLVGYSELLSVMLPPDSPLQKYTGNILQSSIRASAIVQDLLTLARRGITVTEVVNLNSVVDDYLSTPEYEKLRSYHPHVKVKADLEKRLLNITGSPIHLGKVLMNLVSNAAEAISEKGQVTIKTENRYLDRPLVGYEEIREGEYVACSVTDNGNGITAADIKRIFEPFFTKKIMGRSGTGLGLAVVWGTVRDHNGYIDVQSEEGKGSSFTLYFPVTREMAAGVKAPVAQEFYGGHGEKILIVDDVAGQRDLAQTMLERLGYAVETVSSGEEAVEYLKANKADLILLDMIMDPGIDGLETYRQILEKTPRQKAVIVSGYSETERVRQAQALGAGSYVRKPYMLATLGIAVKKEIERL